MRWGRNQWLLGYQRQQFDSNIWRQAVGEPDSPQYSPDGGRIAFISDRSGYWELWVADAAGRNETALTSFGKYHLGSPRRSLDGRRIAFDALEGDRRAIFAIDAAGSAPRRLTAWEEVGRPSWSADGRWVYFFRQRGSVRDIWRVPANSDGSAAPVQMTRGGGFEGYELSDGKQFYYMKDTESHELWRLPLAGGEPRMIVAKGISHGWWALRDDGVVFADTASEEDAPAAKTVYFYSFQTGQHKKVGRLSGDMSPNTPDFTVSPDFKQIAFGRFDAANTGIETLVWPGK